MWQVCSVYLNGAQQRPEHERHIKQIVNVLNLRSLQSQGVSGLSRLVSVRPEVSSALLRDWSEYLTAAVLRLVRKADDIGHCGVSQIRLTHNNSAFLCRWSHYLRAAMFCCVVESRLAHLTSLEQELKQHESFGLHDRISSLKKQQSTVYNVTSLLFGRDTSFVRFQGWQYVFSLRKFLPQHAVWPRGAKQPGKTQLNTMAIRLNPLLPSSGEYSPVFLQSRKNSSLGIDCEALADKTCFLPSLKMESFYNVEGSRRQIFFLRGPKCFPSLI